MERDTILSGLLLLVCLLALPATAQRAHSREARDAAIAKASNESARAVESLFDKSDLTEALVAAQNAIDAAREAASPSRTLAARADALFVQMEAYGLQGNTGAELDAALHVCELPIAGDARTRIAAARILNAAGNTREFRAMIARVRALAALPSSQSQTMKLALLTAALDGVSELNASELAREAGVITEWHIAGPFGEYANVAFDKAWQPERNGELRASYAQGATERFHVDSGQVKLPNYFSSDGVFYAEGTFSSVRPGEWRVQIETPGTINVWIDGESVASKDSRFEMTSHHLEAATKLAPGKHNVLVKFIADALPFRVAVVPVLVRAKASARTLTAVESKVDPEYVKAESSLSDGDYLAAFQLAKSMRARHESSAIDLLLARVWRGSGDSGGEAIPLLRSALRLSPTATTAALDIAQIELARGNFQEAFSSAKQVADAEPDTSAAELMAHIAANTDLPFDATGAVETAARLHPSCSVLKTAAAFFARHSDYERAQQYEKRLQGCAPGSTAWAEALSQAGRHKEAVAELTRITEEYPLDRAASKLLVHEAALAGQLPEARAEAHRLAQMASNSDEFQSYAAHLDDGDELIDSAAANRNFADENPFYSPFRRDGMHVANETVPRKQDDLPAEFLLKDKIVDVANDGSARIYVHTVTRVLNAKGISQFGEVGIPSEAAVLELRTIKADGTVSEPERTPNKTTISMPGLTPGDVVDVEYVASYDSLSDEDASQFTFGSFVAPTNDARFVVISRDDAPVKFEPEGSVPTVAVRLQGEQVIRTWQAQDIRKFETEVSMTRTGALPVIQLFAAESNGWASVRDFYRDEFITASRITPRVAEAVEQLRSAATDEARLRAAFRLITLRLRSTRESYDSGEITSADTTFAAYAGSRTAALLAVTNALGMKPQVLMTRDSGDPSIDIPTVRAYSHPLLVFSVSGKQIVLDAEMDGIGFGGVSGSLELDKALVVPIHDSASEPLFAAVPTPLADNHSVAQGDVTLSPDGDLTAHLTIRMGANRGAQIRSMLGGMEQSERQHFFEQLASRIFAGAKDVKGEVQNERDPNNPVILVVDCTAPHFVDFSKGTVELRQLVPELGLKKMYATDDRRKTTLLIATPLFETSSFRIHLPQGIELTSLARDMVDKTGFGTYSVTFRRPENDVIEVERYFDIPVQTIDPASFPSFSEFARRIDSAEQQRITLKRDPNHS